MAPGEGKGGEGEGEGGRRRCGRWTGQNMQYLAPNHLTLYTFHILFIGDGSNDVSLSQSWPKVRPHSIESLGPDL